jgi:hypothetical protein
LNEKVSAGEDKTILNAAEQQVVQAQHEGVRLAAKLSELNMKLEQRNGALGKISTETIRLAQIQPLSADETRIRRNRLQLAIIDRSNSICDYHKGAIIAQKSMFDFSTSLLSTLLGTASGAVGGETAARILGAASGGVTATSAALNASIYQNLLTTAIIKSIENSREEFKANTIKPKRNESAANYSVDQAIIDANDYHRLCSFYRGIVALADDDGPKPLTREEILAEIKLLEGLMAEQQAIFRRPENAANTREFQDARFQWDAYSTRKKQLTALLLNPNTPGRFGAKKRPTSEIEDEILDKAFPTLNVKWKDWVPKADEITLVLEAIHGRSEMLRLLNKDLDISKSKKAATYRRLYGYFEEVQLMLAAVAAGAAPARTLVIDSFIGSDQSRTEIGTQNAAASILVNPNQLNKILGAVPDN